MARIPLQVAGRGLETGSAVQYSGSDPVGRALQGFGGAVQDVGNDFSRLAEIKARQEEEVANFTANQNLQQLKIGAEGDLDTTQQKSPASGQGLHDTFLQSFDKRTNEFLASVPPNLKERYQKLAETTRAIYSQDAAKRELDQRNGWYKQGIKDSLQTWQNTVFQNPAQFDGAVEEFNRQVDASGLPAEERQQIKKDARQTFVLTLSEREIRNAEADPSVASSAPQKLGIAGGGTVGGGDAAKLLRQYEDFRDKPYWDVNAWRVGYGSDTITKADGTIKRVEQGDRVSRDDAERDLARRSKEFEMGALKQVGAAAWERLTPAAQAALVSVTYNYGSLPRAVASAVRGGSLPEIAAAVENLKGHNDGINAGRRAQEAAVIRGNTPHQTVDPGQALAEMDPRYAELPLSKRLEILDRMNATAQAGEKQRAAEQKASYAAYKDNLELQILTGGVQSEETILTDNTLADGDKSTLLRSFRTQQGEANSKTVAAQAYVNGQMVNLNPLDTDESSQANKAFDSLSEALRDQPDEQRQAFTQDFVRTTGIIPQSIQADLRRANLASDPGQLAAGMDQAARMEALAPDAFRTMSGGTDLQKDLASFRHMVNDRGMSAQDAAKKLLERRSPEFQTNEKVLGEKANKAVKDLTSAEMVSALDPSGLFNSPGAGADPATQNALTAEYQEAVRDEFIANGGDLEDAKTRAQTSLKQTWGVSNISGKSQLMKYPPERFYPAVAGGFDYLQEDAKATAKEIAGADPKSVYLSPDPATAADIRAGRPPRYRLFYTREVDGQTIRDQVPGLWAIDPNTMKAKTDAAREAALQAAQEQRSKIDTAQDAERSILGLPLQSPRDQRDLIRGRLGSLGGLVPSLVTPAQGVELPQGRQGRVAPGRLNFEIPANPGSREAIADQLRQQREELMRNAPR